MTRCGCVSAANISLKCNDAVKIKDFWHTSRSCGLKLGSNCFTGSEFIGTSLRIVYNRIVNERSSRNVYPLQVQSSSASCLMKEFVMNLQNLVFYLLLDQVRCIDYPRPELENTVNFLEAAQLSAAFHSAPHPSKPLKVVIAGAGKREKNAYFDSALCFLGCLA